MPRGERTPCHKGSWNGPGSGERPATKHYRTGQPPQRATATSSSLTGWDYAGAFKYRVAAPNFSDRNLKRREGENGLPVRGFHRAFTDSSAARLVVLLLRRASRSLDSDFCKRPRPAGRFVARAWWPASVVEYPSSSVECNYDPYAHIGSLGNKTSLCACRCDLGAGFRRRRLNGRGLGRRRLNGCRLSGLGRRRASAEFIES
jgi:hypothetical protein